MYLRTCSIIDLLIFACVAMLVGGVLIKISETISCVVPRVLLEMSVVVSAGYS